MKTKKIISAMVQCISNKSCIGCIYEYDDNCHKAIMEDAKNRLMDYVAEIDGLKKNVEALRKELAEREAAPGWISLEERLPEVGEDVLLKYENNLVSGFLQLGNEWCCYTGNGWVTAADESENPTHWMPIPETPKKVKTYKDVFLEAFPNADMIEKVTPRVCRLYIFGSDTTQQCEWNCTCEDCWNQPYPEEEGDQDGNA